MSAFISQGQIYVYKSTTDTFDIIPFDGEIISGSSYNDVICIIDSNNELWGRGGTSILGLPNTINTRVFTKIPIPVKVTKVLCAWICTVVIDENGNIWYTGRLGKLESPIFAQLTNFIPFINVSCGSQNILAVDINGDLWGYGNNYDSVLGVEHTYLNEFTKTTEGGNFVTVHSTNAICVSVDSTGQVWGRGREIGSLLGLDFTGKPWEFKIIAENIIVRDAVADDNAVYLLTQDNRVFRHGLYTFGIHRVQEKGVYQEIAEGITVSQMKVFKSKIIVKDEENNIWIAGFWRTRIYPFQMIPNITGDTLLDQRITPMRNKRLWTTKSARN